jgi:hypothetical protein
MKLKIALLALVLVAGTSVSVAVADPGHGKGKKPKGDDAVAATTGESTTTDTVTTGDDGKGKGHKAHGKAKGLGLPGACRPSVAVNLKGTLAGVTDSTLAVDVTKANRHGWNLVGLQVPVAVDALTKIRKHGPATLADLVAGDVVKIHARACKNAEAVAGAAPVVLVARMVIAKAPSTSTDSEDGATTTTDAATTDTSTTDTSTTETTTTTETQTTTSS